MSDNFINDMELVKRDSQSLGRGMELVLNRNNQESAATALFDEFQKIAERGDDHVRKIFNEVEKNVGSSNFFSHNARIRDGSLCLTPGYMRNVAESAVLPTLRMVCASTDGTIYSSDGQSHRIQPGHRRSSHNE